jgi:hypothetical protein
MKLSSSNGLCGQLALLAAALCIAGWALTQILEPGNLLGLLLAWSHC